MITFAFLPQHVWEVGGSVLAILVMGQGLYLLARAGEVARQERQDERTVRAFGLIATFLGLGIGVAALTTDAEPPGAHHGDGWGGALWIAILCIWVVGLCAWPVSRMVSAHHDKKDRGL
jgi:hypothetical protein